MSSLQLKDKWVLITGASAGLGKELAIQLARDYHANLILVARRENKLSELQSFISNQYAVQVKYLVADLSVQEDLEKVYQFSIAQNVYGMILNAGVTYFGEDCQLEFAQAKKIIETNINSVVFLTQKFTQYFESKKLEGALMLVSSMAAMFPAPYQSIYSGTKSFLFSYGHALSHELKNKQFSISIFAPGGMQTEMTEGDSFGGLQKWLMPVNQAAKDALSGFAKRKYTILPGWQNRIGAKFMRLLPLKFLGNQMEKVYKKSLDNSK